MTETNPTIRSTPIPTSASAPRPAAQTISAPIGQPPPPPPPPPPSPPPPPPPPPPLPPPPPPTPAATSASAGVSAQTAMSNIQDELQRTLTQMGQDVARLAPQIQAYMNAIAPEISDAVQNGDLASLPYIRDRVAAHLGRVSLGYLAQQQTVVTNTIITTLSMLIKIGIGMI